MISFRRSFNVKKNLHYKLFYSFCKLHISYYVSLTGNGFYCYFRRGYGNAGGLTDSRTEVDQRKGGEGSIGGKT